MDGSEDTSQTVHKPDILRHLSKLTSAKGRFDTIYSSDRITGIVDYAHTPDALKNVLQTISDKLS